MINETFQTVSWYYLIIKHGDNNINFYHERIYVFSFKYTDIITYFH